MRTLKSTPLALTVGSQTWVRKVLREIGLPTLVVVTSGVAFGDQRTMIMVLRSYVLP